MHSKNISLYLFLEPDMGALVETVEVVDLDLMVRSLANMLNHGNKLRTVARRYIFRLSSITFPLSPFFFDGNKKRPD
jgi:hypothetical protein